MGFFQGEDQAKHYKQSRPQYTQELYETIFKYCEENNGQFKLAVNVGCGTGDQSTLPLLSRFEKVIGVEFSEEQLKHAPVGYPNLTFRQSKAEDLHFLSSGSVDLVTAATSAHWFNISAFFQEAERVLTPGGCLAVYGYGFISLQERKAQQILQEFAKINLEEFNHERMVLVQKGYKDLHLPFPGFRRCNVDCKMDWTVDRLCGYIASTVRWQERQKVHPHCDSLDKLSYDLLRFYRKHTGKASPRLAVVFSVAMLLGMKPYYRV